MEFLQVLRRGLQQVSGHNGLRGWLRMLFRANDVRVGTLVGEDKYGNKYYEDNKQFFGRHRWVIYTTEMNGRNTFWDVDGSMVPPEWLFHLGLVAQLFLIFYDLGTFENYRHRWLHCMTDDPPTTKPPTARKFIWTNHKFNLSGTSEQYVPYSTTRKKIQEWVPPSTPYK
ncbi:NADH dehydrogenase [ubiquinone] 1 alpha subcomplex subunit 12 isoform X1 [Myotis daubentonii]|uniref:NADH dehydrogenase [ubiquinone] 1 alpha subcomplex subunit 12 isoform X1 n=1 Tax=Myotis daubentonii TaxID=98922 RepID=UPI002872F195|nr:NADH dehydrogenase [ubiquinone] 1 alpha subcomplex subunit 12 isoform X1 [Myotis daubentonii]